LNFLTMLRVFEIHHPVKSPSALPRRPPKDGI